jgi:hypothetical protein
LFQLRSPASKRGDESFRWVATFSEAAIELFEIVETVVRAGGQAVNMANHAIDESGLEPQVGGTSEGVGTGTG